MLAPPCRALLASTGPLLATPASAHLVSTNLGPVYDSALHFLTSHEYLAPVAALALWAGFQGARHARWTLFVVTGAWLLGASVGIAPPMSTPTPWTAGTCLVLGALLAADLTLPLALAAALAATVGLLGGAMSTAAQTPPLGIPSRVAIAGSVFVVSTLTASLVVPLRVLWMRIAVRVAGSWLAALGLLLFGWLMRAAR